MYLHLGNDSAVPLTSVIGIFDLDRTSQSAKTRAFLTRAQKEGLIKTVNDELPSSFVLCQKDGKTSIYLSQISSLTLGKRFFNIQFRSS